LLDLSTIGVSLYFLFFILLILVSMYVSHAKEVTVDSYFFANRNTHWLVLGTSFVTGSIFSPYILGLTSSGSISGLAIVYGIVSAIMLGILGWFFAPVYLNSRTRTLPEYFEKRFNRDCKFYLSTLYIFCNIFIRLLIILVAGSIFINTITGVDAFSSLLFFLIITGTYVIIGGLQAELYVGIVQVLFIILGVAGFTGWVVNQGDGMRLMMGKIAPFVAGSEFTWTGLAFGLPIIGFWFWCADQCIVQKVLSVRNVHSARKATLVSGFLQVIPVLIFIIPGIILVTLFPNASSEEALHTLFSGGFLPDSLRGGLIIAVAAALMASFASLFNSTSLLITFDFYRSFKPDASERKLVLVGRMTTMILLFYAVLLIPISQTMDFNVCLKLLKSFTYFAAMISAVFVIGLLNQRINGVSALLTLCAGTAVVVSRSALEMFLDTDRIGNTLFRWFAQSGFLEFSVFIFLLSVLFMFAFNRLEWVQHAVKIGWNFHRTVFLALSALIIIVVWWTLL